MGKLLRFEFRKLFRAKSFYILAAILVGWIVIDCLLTGLPGRFKDPQEIAPLYPFLKGLITNIFMIVIGLFVAIYCSQDMALGTIKNIYGKGFSRAKVYFSKYIVTLVASFIIAIVVYVVTLPFFPLFDLSQPIQDNVFLIALGIILGIVAYHGIFFAISMSFKHLAASISINMVIPVVISPIVTLIDATALKDISFKISPYWIDGLLGVFNYGATSDSSKFFVSYLLLIAYALVGIFVGFMVARKKEV